MTHESLPAFQMIMELSRNLKGNNRIHSDICTVSSFEQRVGYHYPNLAHELAVRFVGVPTSLSLSSLSLLSSHKHQSSHFHHPPPPKHVPCHQHRVRQTYPTPSIVQPSSVQQQQQQQQHRSGQKPHRSIFDALGLGVEDIVAFVRASRLKLCTGSSGRDIIAGLRVLDLQPHELISRLTRDIIKVIALHMRQNLVVFFVDATGQIALHPPWFAIIDGAQDAMFKSLDIVININSIKDNDVGNMPTSAKVMVRKKNLLMAAEIKERVLETRLCDEAFLEEFFTIKELRTMLAQKKTPSKLSRTQIVQTVLKQIMERQPGATGLGSVDPRPSVGDAERHRIETQ